MNKMSVEPISRAHLKRTVQLKREKEMEIKAIEASFIAIDKKAKRNEAKARREAMKCFKMKDMCSALEEINVNPIDSMCSALEESIVTPFDVDSMFSALSI
jgi:hypothetical protein